MPGAALPLFAPPDGVYEGLFTLGPSRVSGAVQAIINPIFLY